MILPDIPEITDFSDWMDLLASTPKMAARLAEIKKAQDMVNARLGDYKVFSKLKSQQNEIASNLTESRQAKADALAEAKKIVDKAKADATAKTAAAEKYVLNIQEKIKELAQKESIVDARAKENDAKALEIANQQAWIKDKLTEIGNRESMVEATMKTLRDKHARTLELWNS